MNKQNQFRVGILTPYLTGNILERCGEDNDELRFQKEKYGAQDIRDVLGEFKEQEKGIYVRRSELEVVLDLRPTGEENTRDILQKADLAVVGCTVSHEQSVFFFKDSGLLFARCSIFYGKPSGYTSFTPEEAGYAFDVPKDKEKVFSFITDEKTARAILKRDAQEVRKSIDELNQRLRLSEPILVTPYFDQALDLSRDERKRRTEKIIGE